MIDDALQYFDERYVYFDEKQKKWRIKKDCPDEIKVILEKFFKMHDETPDENGIVTIC